MAIIVNLDVMMAKRKISLNELAEKRERRLEMCKGYLGLT